MAQSRSATYRRSTLVLLVMLAAAAIAVVALVVHAVRKDGQNGGSANVREPRVVSLLPQATDILESMGCGDHLVAVTGVDDDPAVAGLPRVGDYQTTDWETISRLRPKVIITHYGTGKTPAGFVEHAQAIGATQFNLLTETLNGPDPDSTIYHAIDELGKACQEPQKAAEASARLRGRLDEVARRASSHAKVTALIVIGSEGTMVAGRDSYLSELLDLAGGTNAAAGLNARYPNLDWEQILALKPEVIFQLLPRASDQITDQAKKSWSGLAEVPAVKNGRVVQLTAWYVMLPGYHVADVAEQFEQALHSQHAANN